MRRMTGKKRKLLLLGTIVVLAIAGAATAFLVREHRLLYHFHVVEPGVFYRSGQLERSALERVRAATGIRTIIDLSVERRDHPLIRDEVAFAAEEGIRYVHLPVPPGAEGIEPFVERFLEVMDDLPGRPVLLHCWHGVHRTGLMTAVFRMEYQRATNEEALEGLALFGRDKEDFGPGDREFIAGYVPRWRRVR